ncbi:hypothetical protein ACWKSP_09680 [Micromonosporaceae bacterium Da 78-11]
MNQRLQGRVHVSADVLQNRGIAMKASKNKGLAAVRMRDSRSQRTAVAARQIVAWSAQPAERRHTEVAQLPGEHQICRAVG